MRKNIVDGRNQTIEKNEKVAKKSVRVQLRVAVGLVLAGCVLLGFAFASPPLGVVDPSVLVAFGEILTFAGALFGIDYHYHFKN